MSLRIATFNVHNLGADVSPVKLARLTEIIAQHLDYPEILALQEIKSSETPDHRGQIPATCTYRRLIEQLASSGGPTYEALEVAPLHNQDGGQVGSNIRVGFLFNPELVTFAARGSRSAVLAAGVQVDDARLALTLNPGRIEPKHAAFCGDPEQGWVPSRKALVGEFEFAGQSVVVVNCHLKSMRAQTRGEEERSREQRHAQARIIHDFVRTLLALNPELWLLVLGDMNDTPGSKTLTLLRGGLLEDALESLPKRQRYTRRYGGRPQNLDHVLLAPSLIHRAKVKLPHVCSDASSLQRASDHDPVLLELDCS